MQAPVLPTQIVRKDSELRRPRLTRDIRANNRLLFDHLVGAYHQGQGHFEAERLGGFQVDDEL